jgi:hypothetical protein
MTPVKVEPEYFELIAIVIDSGNQKYSLSIDPLIE